MTQLCHFKGVWWRSFLNRAKRAYSTTLDQNKNKTNAQKISPDPGVSFIFYLLADIKYHDKILLHEKILQTQLLKFIIDQT